jgi:prephenate dehydrogenase
MLYIKLRSQVGLESLAANSETPTVHWKKVTLIGVGLLGGSLGMAIRQRRLAGCVTGFVRRRLTGNQCKQLGAVDTATLDLEQAVADADLVVLSTPIAQMRPLAEQMCSFLKPGAIVTDVGSVKLGVVKALSPLLSKAGAHFVGSHPMAGSERTGVAAARADLFAGAVCVVTPIRQTNHAAVRRVMGLWKSVGSHVFKLAPEVHDDLVSRSSHLPHVVAAQLANLVLHPRSGRHQALLCANGFRDATRIASGSPEMWRDIALANRENLLATLDDFSNGLADFKRALKRGDPAAISRFFQEAKVRRDKWSRTFLSFSPE